MLRNKKEIFAADKLLAVEHSEDLPYLRDRLLPHKVSYCIHQDVSFDMYVLLAHVWPGNRADRRGTEGHHLHPYVCHWKDTVRLWIANIYLALETWIPEVLDIGNILHRDSVLTSLKNKVFLQLLAQFQLLKLRLKRVYMAICRKGEWQFSFFSILLKLNALICHNIIWKKIVVCCGEYFTWITIKYLLWRPRRNNVMIVDRGQERICLFWSILPVIVVRIVVVVVILLIPCSLKVFNITFMA